MYYFLSILVDSARKARAVFLATTSAIQIINNSWGVVMHIRKYLSIFLIGLVFAIAGCSGSSSSGSSDNELLPDTDNDGIVDNHDGDIDGDGKPNQNDDDIDGDGVTNDKDGDDDGDGTPDATDPTPEGPGDNSQSKKNCADNGGTWDNVSNQCAPIVGDSRIDVCINSGGIWEFSQCTEEDAREVANPCTSAKIIVPNEELQTGTKTKVKWKLQPEGCELTEERNKKIQVTAFNQYAKPATEKTGTPHVGKGHGQIHIPNNCNWDRTTTKKITYDFTALGTALGDPQANTSAYKQDVTHPVGRGENCNPTPIVDPVFIVGPADNELTVNADGSVTGPGNAAVYAMANGGLVKELKEPTWSSTPAGYMNIYINGGAGKNERITIEPGRSNGKYYVGSEGPGAENFGTWEELQASEYGGYSVRTNYGPEVEGAASPGDPIKRGGNFVLRLNAATFTLNKYSVN